MSPYLNLCLIAHKFYLNKQMRFIMIFKLLKFLAILFCLAIIGCATTGEVRRTPRPEGKNLDIAINQVFENIKQQVTQTQKPLKVFTTNFTNLYNQESNLDKFITGEFKSKFSSSSEFILLDQTKLDKLLGDMRIGLKDLNDPIVRVEFVKYTEADAIFFGKTEHIGYKDAIQINTWILDLHTGNKIADISKDVEKDNRIRRFLEEKIPGELLVKTHPSGTEVYLNSGRQGITTNSGLLINVPPGSHYVRIDKPGYVSFNKNIYMPEDGFKRLEVKFEEDNSAPLKCMLASAVLPGLGGIFYGSPKTIKGVKRPKADAWLATSATTFYVVGFLYAWDEFVEDPNFFSKKHQKEFDQWKNAELYITIGAYAINLISSIAVGSEYTKRNRTAKELSLLKNEPTFVYSLKPVNHNGFQVGMNIKF